MARLTRLLVHCLVISVAASLGIAHADTRYVGAGEAFTTIQSAIDASSNGDLIIVRDGTYTGTGNRDIDFKGKAVHLKSENGAERCIIDVQGSSSSPQRCFSFHSGEGAKSIIQGFTIRGGYAIYEGWPPGSGAGIYCEHASPTITKNIIVVNIATYGGGIYVDADSMPTIIDNTINWNTALLGGGVFADCDSSPTISGNTITGNYAQYGDGGGVYVGLSSTARILDNTITDNHASGGAGLYCSPSAAVITGNTIRGNTAQSRGGGIWASGSTIANNTIQTNSSSYGYGGGVSTDGVFLNNLVEGNTATQGSGGGIWSDGGSVTGNTIVGNTAVYYDGGGIASGGPTSIGGNTISGNKAGRRGGGISCGWPSSAAEITGNAITGNSCSQGGGGVYRDGSVVICTLVNNVIAYNTSSGPGGGMMAEGPEAVTLENNTVTGNIATGPGGGLWLQGSSATVKNCIVWSNTVNSAPEIVTSNVIFTFRYNVIKGGRSGLSAGIGNIIYWGAGNIDADPMFADSVNGDFHLKSKDGRWLPAGSGSGGTWVKDSVMSPCINAGDPGSDISSQTRETRRIEMGAYGNTPEASKGKWVVFGDADGNSRVDVLDLIFLRNRLGQNVDTADNWKADVNEDGRINVLDLIYARNRLGTSRP